MTHRIVPRDLRGIPRLSYIRAQLRQVLDQVRPTMVVFEDYVKGFRAGTGRLTELGEVGGVLRLLAYESGADVVLVPVTSLKIIVAEKSKGKLDKNDVQAALKNVYGYDVAQHDEADALALMLIGEHLCGSKELNIDARRKASLDKCLRIRGQAKLTA